MKELFQHLKSKNLTPNGYYLLYCLAHNEFIELPIAYKTEMARLQLIGLLDEQFNLTPEAKVFLDTCSKAQAAKPKKITLTIDEKFKENVEAYRLIFPSAKLSGKITRSAVNDIIPRMMWFFNMYPHFSWANVLSATKKYIISLNGEYKYCMTAAYFIKKDDVNRNTLSRLATFCEAELDEDEQGDLEGPIGFNKLV